MVREDLYPCRPKSVTDLETLYSWSFNDAQDAQNEWDKIEHGKDEKGPLYLWVDAQKLLDLAYAFQETKDNKILLFAIHYCAMDGFAIPKWCAIPYLNAFRDVWHHRKKSWDDTFGSPHKKGARLGALQEKRQKKYAVYSQISKMKSMNPDTPTDRSLFDQVGKEFGVSGSLAEKYYYDVKNTFKMDRETRLGKILDTLLDSETIKSENPGHAD
jgi:hypothetical protein